MKVIAITDQGVAPAELHDDDSVTVEKPWIINADQPQHGQVTVMVDGQPSNIVYADFQKGVWTVDRLGELIRVFFAGRVVCPHCLHHHDRGECGA